jgi:hypothetical protein
MVGFISIRQIADAFGALNQPAGRQASTLHCLTRQNGKCVYGALHRHFYQTYVSVSLLFLSDFKVEYLQGFQVF